MPLWGPTDMMEETRMMDQMITLEAVLVADCVTLGMARVWTRVLLLLLGLLVEVMIIGLGAMPSVLGVMLTMAILLLIYLRFLSSLFNSDAKVFVPIGEDHSLAPGRAPDDDTGKVEELLLEDDGMTIEELLLLAGPDGADLPCAGLPSSDLLLAPGRAPDCSPGKVEEVLPSEIKDMFLAIQAHRRDDEVSPCACP
ncbi:unnamed protein product [Prorocentrum cordatum]|uniref:Uncharacterized protein n=1 Tax=Prorocentrum cordatum TaxID=2364126 RepID=A0ABN9WDL6_9DINO|nr:unnamed protein product [Polarella glacialis]